MVGAAWGIAAVAGNVKDRALRFVSVVRLGGCEAGTKCRPYLDRDVCAFAGACACVGC